MIDLNILIGCEFCEQVDFGSHNLTGLTGILHIQIQREGPMGGAGAMRAGPWELPEPMGERPAPGEGAGSSGGGDSLLSFQNIVFLLRIAEKGISSCWEGFLDEIEQ